MALAGGPPREPAPPGPAHRRLAVVAGSVTALVLATLIGGSLAFAHQAACRAGAFSDQAGVAPLRAHCYSDVYVLYDFNGLVHGKVPYLSSQVDYPVLIGAVMQAASWATRSVAGDLRRNLAFYDVTTAGLVLFAVAGVLATAFLAGRSRRWTALAVALSPGLILAAFINWDLMAMALTAGAMAAWAARRPVLAGVLFGLAVAAKFYPLILLAALFPLCLRAGRLRALLVTASAAVVTWLAVNVPVAVVAFHGWSTFYRDSSAEGSDWGSAWYAIRVAGLYLKPATLNIAAPALMLLGFAAITWLVLAAPRRPRVPQVLFLALAVFLMLNKAWSPQYVVWLVPLVVLARPRLWAYLLWQAAEVAYIFAIWSYLITAAYGRSGGIGSGLYFAALAGRFLTVALLAALIVRDILRPDKDLVRRDGDDDPAGGVLDGAPDAVILGLRTRPALIG